MANEKDIDNLDAILKKASEEILASQDGYFFSMEDQQTELGYESAYNSHELAEFVNFDMVGESSDDINDFSHLITGTKYEDLTGNRDVLKILLDQGECMVFHFYLWWYLIS